MYLRSCDVYLYYLDEDADNMIQGEGLNEHLPH